MISVKEGRKHTCFLRWLGASEEEFTPGTSGQSIMPTQVMIEEINPKGNNTAPNHRGYNKAPSGHQLQGAEAAGALEEDMGISPGKSIAYSVVRTKAILQECAKSLF